MGLFVGLLQGLMLFTAVILILLVMVQRGKGGGLAGAFGGMGGQSAFGTKAGDLFTKITIVVAAFWIVLCTVTVGVVGAGIGEAGMFDRPVIEESDGSGRMGLPPESVDEGGGDTDPGTDPGSNPGTTPTPETSP